MEAYAFPIDTCIKRAVDEKRLKCSFIFPYLTGVEDLDTTVHTTEKQIKSSKLWEGLINLFFVDSNPLELMQKYSDNSFIENNQEEYIASLFLFHWLVLKSNY